MNHENLVRSGLRTYKRYRPSVTAIVLILSAVVVSSAFAGPLPSVPPPTVPGADTLLHAEDLVYSERIETDELERILARARRSFSEISSTALQAYWEARAVLLLGTHLNTRDESRRARAVLEEGLNLVETALTPGEFSDGLRLFADMQSQMMFARGFMYMMRHGEATRDATLRAVELDPENVRALITAAGYYLNAPGIAGGDVEKGIEILQDALDLDPENENDRFLILGWLAEAHGSLGDTPAGRRYLAQARRIYPDSTWLREISENL